MASQLAALSAFGPALGRAALAPGVLAEDDRAFGEKAARHPIYPVRRLFEHELYQMYMKILTDACDNARTEWKPAGFDARAGFWEDGGGNGSIRTVVSMLLACATVIRYRDRADQAALADLTDQV
jgi:hypothetical protein